MVSVTSSVPSLSPKKSVTFQSKPASMATAPASSQSDTPSPIILENEWTIWYDRYPGPNLPFEQYKAALKELGTFQTVQDFWRWFNNLPPADDLGPRTSYHLMKKGIYPLWEDEANVNGGELAIKIDRNVTGAAWLYMLLAVIGEQFSGVIDSADEICGVTVSVRKNETCLSIWNRSTKKFDQKKMEQSIKNLMPSIRFKDASYKVHKTEVISTLKHNPITQIKNQVLFPHF